MSFTIRSSPLSIASTLAGVVALSAACSSDSPTDGGDFGPIGAGEFSATVSGAIEASFEGMAVFASDENAITVSMTEFPETMNSLLVTRFGPRPGPGTYMMGALPFLEPMTFGAGGQADDFPFGSESGTLTVTESTPDRFVGSMIFQAADTLGNVNMTVEATFEAVCGSPTPQNPDCS